jgi:outer membrane protein assembly factor BamD
MIDNRVKKYPARGWGVGRFGSLFALLVVFVVGCAGGVPRVPNSAQGVLERGDAYFDRKMYFHSQEMYKAFLLRYPGDDRSDYAQFKLGESLFYGEEYALAAVEYHVVTTNYGYSEWVDDAYFKEALCYYHQGLKPPLDQTKRLDALERMERFITVFPQSPLIPEAQEHIREIHAKLAEKGYKNALFYYRNKRWRSALIYFDKVIDNYPDNKFWARSCFYKGLILVKRDETDEAVRMFSKVMAYPEDVDVKPGAQRELRRLREQGDG